MTTKEQQTAYNMVRYHLELAHQYLNRCDVSEALNQLDLANMQLRQLKTSPIRNWVQKIFMSLKEKLHIGREHSVE